LKTRPALKAARQSATTGVAYDRLGEDGAQCGRRDQEKGDLA